MIDAIAPCPVPPLEKSIFVLCAPARAFQAFTAEIGQWWPLSTHSVGQDQAQAVVIEPRVGGRIFETDGAGAQADWGRVLEWSPPDRFVMTWHPGRAADTAQVVELGFAAEGSGTRVTLLHRGWESLGAAAGKARESYDGGWDTVLAGHYAGFCGRFA